MESIRCYTCTLLMTFQLYFKKERNWSAEQKFCSYYLQFCPVMANAYYNSPTGHGIQNRMLKFIVGLFDSKNPLTTWGLLWGSFDKVLAGSNPKPQWREMMLLIIYFFVQALAHDWIYFVKENVKQEGFFPFWDCMARRFISIIVNE